ncbi:nuclear transport factor 2 family protein [Nocardia brasiliensis]|uniref:nuclear transport factor 2 family protein n=1 Tax=Nocardia brasiliensis TaxID=37326 RepID=UPI0004A7451F|nr:nuclear transport factor 2 family protein [Nocardia brasiliensis]
MLNPGEVVDRALSLLLAQDMSGFADLWAREGVLEFPFAPPGYPERLVGRAAIAEYLRDYPSILDLREITSRTVHQSVDPEVVIVEFEAAGRVVATGKPYRMRYVAVITVRYSRIQHYRDYWNPLAAADLLGGAEELTSAFSGGDRG